MKGWFNWIEGGILIKRKNRFCEKRQLYCKFANRCAYCHHNVGWGWRDKSIDDWKSKDYVRCRGNNSKCFSCNIIKFLNEEQSMKLCSECIKVKIE